MVAWGSIEASAERHTVAQMSPGRKARLLAKLLHSVDLPGADEANIAKAAASHLLDCRVCRKQHRCTHSHAGDVCQGR